jgi:hypothetical protein
MKHRLETRHDKGGRAIGQLRSEVNVSEVGIDVDVARVGRAQV